MTATGEASAATSCLCARSQLTWGQGDTGTPPSAELDKATLDQSSWWGKEKFYNGRRVTASTNCYGWIMTEIVGSIASTHIAFLFKSFLYFLFFCFLLLPVFAIFPQFSNCRCVSQTTTVRSYSSMIRKTAELKKKNKNCSLFYFFV